MESRHLSHSASGFQRPWELKCMPTITISTIRIQRSISQSGSPCGIKSLEPLGMEYIIEELNYYPVSLGANCFSRMYLEKIYKKSYPRLPFDYVGSPMWGINEAIEADFKGFASKQDIAAYKIYENSESEVLTNSRYLISFLHDHKHIRISDEKYNQVENDYSRRIQRWKHLIEGESKLLFFRLMRSEQNRIQYIQGKPSEKEALEQFSRAMKTKNLNFRILYFTYEQPNWYDPESQIIYVNIPKIEKITDNLIKKLLSDIDTFKYIKQHL